jgi:hypothetical protein
VRSGPAAGSSAGSGSRRLLRQQLNYDEPRDEVQNCSVLCISVKRYRRNAILNVVFFKLQIN